MPGGKALFSCFSLGKGPHTKGAFESVKSPERAKFTATCEIAGQQGSGWASEVLGKYGMQQAQFQDDAVVVDDFCAREDCKFLGVFEGHGPLGRSAARFAAERLPQLLAAHLTGRAAASTVEADPLTGLSEACGAVDAEMHSAAALDVGESGTTACLVLLRCGHLFLANVGDSAAVMARNNGLGGLVPSQLTTTASCDDPAELQRIYGAGGTVYREADAMGHPAGPYRVRSCKPDARAPSLATSRSLGDAALHSVGVEPMPLVAACAVQPYDSFLVLATRALWDVMNRQEVVDFVAEHRRRQRAGACGGLTCAEALSREAAQRRWCAERVASAKPGDIAVVIVFFGADDAGQPQANSLRSSSELAALESLPRGLQVEASHSRRPSVEACRPGTPERAANRATATSSLTGALARDETLPPQQHPQSRSPPAPRELSSPFQLAAPAELPSPPTHPPSLLAHSAKPPLSPLRRTPSLEHPPSFLSASYPSPHLAFPQGGFSHPPHPHQGFSHPPHQHHSSGFPRQVAGPNSASRQAASLGRSPGAPAGVSRTMSMPHLVAMLEPVGAFSPLAESARGHLPRLRSLPIPEGEAVTRGEEPNGRDLLRPVHKVVPRVDPFLETSSELVHALSLSHSTSSTDEEHKVHGGLEGRVRGGMPRPASCLSLSLTSTGLLESASLEPEAPLRPGWSSTPISPSPHSPRINALLPNPSPTPLVTPAPSPSPHQRTTPQLPSAGIKSIGPSPIEIPHAQSSARSSGNVVRPVGSLPSSASCGAMMGSAAAATRIHMVSSSWKPPGGMAGLAPMLGDALAGSDPLLTALGGPDSGGAVAGSDHAGSSRTLASSSDNSPSSHSVLSLEGSSLGPAEVLLSSGSLGATGQRLVEAVAGLNVEGRVHGGVRPQRSVSDSVGSVRVSHRYVPPSKGAVGGGDGGTAGSLGGMVAGPAPACV